jgi:hypothetical protein
VQDHPDYLIHKTERTDVNEEKILEFDDHGEFSYLAVEIFKEISILIVTVSSIKRSSGGVEIPYNREEAAVFGNLVRYCKISSAYLEQYTKKRAETCMILLRSLMETYINLKYFLKYKDQHTISHYIKHSLKQEKLLLESIRQKEGKDPALQHIEMRMKDSINRSIKDSGFTEEEISNSSKWADKVKQRLNEIIDPSLYIIYGNSSHSVHGNWQDLLFFHLSKSGDGFVQKTEWTTPTIQLIAPLTLMSCDLLRNFAEEVIPASKNKDVLLEEIKDIFLRAWKLDKLHEKFIQKNWTK